MQVTYRGVKYDTQNRPCQQNRVKKEVVETYRGIRHEETVEVVS
jgi:hypothetical protein